MTCPALKSRKLTLLVGYQCRKPGTVADTDCGPKRLVLAPACRWLVPVQGTKWWKWNEENCIGVERFVAVVGAALDDDGYGYVVVCVVVMVVVVVVVTRLMALAVVVVSLHVR